MRKMQANEIRLGLAVSYKGVNFKIQGNRVLTKAYQMIKEGELFAIPLSPVLLMKNSEFEKADQTNNCYKTPNGFWLFNQTEDILGLPKGWYYSSENYVPIDYLHELQELYRVVTKKNLEIHL